MSAELGGAARVSVQAQPPVPQAQAAPRPVPGAKRTDAEASVVELPGALSARAAKAEAENKSGAANEQSRSIDREMLDRAVSAVKDHIEIVERQLDFQVDESTGRTLVSVVDPESGDLIRQLPPEELIAVAEALKALAAEQNREGSLGALSGLLLRAEA